MRELRERAIEKSAGRIRADGDAYAVQELGCEEEAGHAADAADAIEAHQYRSV